MALDPRLAPGGLGRAEADRSRRLHAAGIGVILDLVFNHTGESDELGPTLSLRGLDSQAYYRHARNRPGRLVNDTGTGNTVACNHPIVRELILDALRHFVAAMPASTASASTSRRCSAASDSGFDPHAPLLARHCETIRCLSDRVMIAEPWDIGPDGYQLGNFPTNFLEWNDRFRDDVRRFWRGDARHDRRACDAACRLVGYFRQDGDAQTRGRQFHRRP